jgi:hypothetical protein
VGALRRALALTLALAACAPTASRTVAVPADAQPDLDRCRPTLATWCHGVANGDPPHERDCLEQATREYVEAGTPAARRQYLASHGCGP